MPRALIPLRESPKTPLFPSKTRPSPATAAETLYASAASYPPRDVSPPRMENDGKLTLQALYATGVDPEDDAIREEVRLLGNLQDTWIT